VEQGLRASTASTECIILRPTFIWGKGGEELDIVQLVEISY
jgi:hypothetical protein